MTGPLVTCGVTAFNAEASIERAINSALAQNYRPIEIVVVDDASTDSTPRILKNLAIKNTEIRVFHQKLNRGVAASRNRIIQEARGEFIAFFDDDDESLPTRLHAQLKRILGHESAFSSNILVFCHTARLIKYPNGHKHIWRAMGENENLPPPAGADVARAILSVAPPPSGGQNGSAATCSQMARRSVYITLASFDENFRRHEDDDIAIRAALSGAHFVGIAEPLVIQTLTKTPDKSLNDQRFYGLMLINKYREFLQKEKAYTYALHFHKMRYAFMAGNYFCFFVSAAAAVVSRPISAIRRLFYSIRNIGLNRRMGRFYTRPEE